MEFQLRIPEINLGFTVKHGDGIVLLGSCFSDAMAPHFRNHGFSANSNPFGTIFHPLALARILNTILDRNVAMDPVQRGDLWFDWRSSAHVAGSEDQLQANLQQSISDAHDTIKHSRLLVVSFGTAWGYRHAGQIVANCHKMPQALFEKELTDLPEMMEAWRLVLTRLKAFNPELKCVFTVSPVRHTKDGLAENNRSKARLIELSHQLSENFGSYFPAYELVLDVLRDYRFFKQDMIHPSDQAVEFVWDAFSKSLMDDETREISKKVERLHQMKKHRALYADSDENRIFRKRVEQLENELKTEFPQVFLM